MPFDAAPVSDVAAACQFCPVRNCMSRSNGGEGPLAWAQALAPRMAVMPGAGTLFSHGERQLSIYSVRGGCIKTFTVDAEGNEHIRGFFFPGDIIGLDSLGAGIHRCSAAAVSPAQVCVMPLPALRRVLAQQPALMQSLLERTSRDLAVALSFTGAFSAEQRLAAFLLHLRQRLGAGPVLHLPMAQRDIGGYLRLAPETVCRTLKSFQRRGWLSLGPQTIRIADEPSLQEVAAAVGIAAVQPQLAKAA